MMPRRSPNTVQLRRIPLAHHANGVITEGNSGSMSGTGAGSESWAGAGVQKILRALDSGFRRNDGKSYPMRSSPARREIKSPTLRGSLSRPGRILSVILAVLVLPICFFDIATAQSRAGAISRGGCPDLVDLIRELTPIVVIITIEKHILQQSSTQPAPRVRREYGVSADGGSEGRLRKELDSLGSGFILDETGLIVTNAHVVEGAARILVKLSSGQVCSANVIAAHPGVDLAMLKIKAPHALTKARLGDSAGVKVGEWVLAVGNPFGLGRSATVGIVSGKGRFIGLGPEDDFIQTDASINPGNYGGPLFNMAGEVIGVNTAVIASGKGIGFSIPVNYVQELMSLPESKRRPSRGWLGIYVEDMTDEQARTLGMLEPRGTHVDEVLRSAPAFKAGLRQGDLIVDAAGEQIRNGRHLSRIVGGSKPGDRIKMTVLRKGKSHSLDVVVGQAPQDK